MRLAHLNQRGFVRVSERISATFAQAGGTLDIVIDETLERRWGPKIRKRGH